MSLLSRHPKRRDLERLAKGFSRLVGEKAIEDLLITEVAESEVLSRIECEDLFDGEPDVETVQVYELHENEWIPMFRKKSKRFDDLCKQFLSDYVAGVPDKPFRAALKDANEALTEAVGEYFWDEMPVELDGEWFTESYDAMRDECIEEEDYRRDPYRYFGVSRRDFMASSDRRPRTLRADLRRHPYKRELEAIAKKFRDFFDGGYHGVGDAIDEVVENEPGFFGEIECDDLEDPRDGQFSKTPDMPLDDLYNLRKEKWIPLFRKKDKKFDALCKQFLDLYLSGIDDPKRAYAALNRALIENFWGEIERIYGKNTIGGEVFEEYYGLLRDECDAHGYIQKWGRSSSDRGALIRLASTMEKGSESRRAILAGLQKTAAVEVGPYIEFDGKVWVREWGDKMTPRPGGWAYVTIANKKTGAPGKKEYQINWRDNGELSLYKNHRHQPVFKWKDLGYYPIPYTEKNFRADYKAYKADVEPLAKTLAAEIKAKGGGSEMARGFAALVTEDVNFHSLSRALGGSGGEGLSMSAQDVGSKLGWSAYGAAFLALALAKAFRDKGMAEVVFRAVKDLEERSQSQGGRELMRERGFR